VRLPARSGDQVRIGVAITVPEPYGSVLQAARARFGDPWADFIPPHITLLGPTVIEHDEITTVDEHLAAVAAQHAPFVVRLRGTATFRPVSPVVFVQVSRGITSCEALERAVRSGPVSRNLDFPYHPHVTVAHHLDEPALDRAFESLADFRCAFRVASVELYHHDHDGVWRVLDSFALGG